MSDNRLGSMWTEKETKYYRMDVFDEFENRDNYDYFFYNKKTGRLVHKMLKACHDDALKCWENSFENSRY